MSIVQDWLKTYSYRRYGQSNVKIQKTWGVLYHTIYNCTDGIAVWFHTDAYFVAIELCFLTYSYILFICWLQNHNRDYIVEFLDKSPSSFSSQFSERRSISLARQHPRFFLSEISDFRREPHLWYSTKEAVKALELFINAGDDFSENLTYRYVPS
jgi:alpha-N-acetylglucosaminidase